MTRFYAITTWQKNNPKTLLEVGANVLQNMDGNENFTDPAVPMDTFNKKLSRVQVAFNNRGNGKMAKMELDAASADMDTTLRTQSIYVTETAAGSNLVIQSSGFTPCKGGMTPATLPAMPTDVKLESSNSNVCLIAKKPLGAASLCWIVYYGEVTNKVTVEHNTIMVPAGVSAQIISPGKAREVIKSLTPGLLVSAQVLAQNAAGKSALSNIVSVYVNR